MAKLYFYYSAMNAGKSTLLLQSSHNYHERGLRTLLFTPAMDTRFGRGVIKSRLGVEAPAHPFSETEDLLQHISVAHRVSAIGCVLVDEAQFLSAVQVDQLTRVADELNIPVLCYGLRTDFQGNLFDGSRALLAWADKLVEIKTICHCGHKATMVLRVDAAGRAVTSGAQVEIGGNERYVSVCRKHFRQGQASRE